MPNLADITVKKNNGTTDIVYTGVTAAPGDGSPAVWKSQTVGTAASHQPEFRLTSRDVEKGRARALRGTMGYPSLSTDTTTSITSVIGSCSGAFDVKMPKDLPVADVNEFCAQFTNLVHSALVVACLKAGYTAT